MLLTEFIADVLETALANLIALGLIASVLVAMDRRRPEPDAGGDGDDDRVRWLRVPPKTYRRDSAERSA